MKNSQKEKKTELPIWGERINKLLKEKEMTQKTLAKKSGVAESTLSGWINNKKLHPDIEGLRKIAKAFGDIDVGYLLGDSECEKMNEEAVHRVTGLSDGAIRALEQVRKQAQTSQKEARRDKQGTKLEMLNYLIENIDENELLINMYYYLFGYFYLQEPANPDSPVIPFVKSKKPIEGLPQGILFGKELGQLYFIDIQEDLVEIRKNINAKNKKSEKQERIEYEKWYETEGRKLKEEDWDMEDALEAENDKK